MQGFHKIRGTMLIQAFSIGAFLLSCHESAWAQSGDPPERVGRIAYIQGQVSYRPSAQDPWAEATVNMPMTAGTAIWTQPGSRAEVQVGGARVRLDGGTEVDVLAVDYQNIQLNMPEGRVDIHLGGRRSDESYSIATPRATAGLVADGDYRTFAGDEDNPTRFATFAGEGQFALPSDTVNVDPGEEALASGDPPVIQTGAASQDDFDAWSADRDRRLAARVASRYVSPDVVGYEELDDYGQWRDVPNYGPVWIPTSVQSGWQPYHYGHWRWVDPWGWTWVDDAQWGFAPFHYGRWAHIGDYWGWVPGQVVERPVYAPALVAWVNDPGAIVVGAAIGAAAVGWVTLGPGEAYHPWYHADDNYVRQVNFAYVSRTTINNINNVTVVNNTYVNQRYATVMPRQDFVGARAVNRTALRIVPNAPIRIAAGPQANLPAATQAARFGNGAPHAGAPRPAAFAAARMMQTTRQPAVPVAGRFSGGAVVHAAPTAAANFRPAAAGAGPHAASTPAVAGRSGITSPNRMVAPAPGRAPVPAAAIAPNAPREALRPAVRSATTGAPTVYRGGIPQGTRPSAAATQRPAASRRAAEERIVHPAAPRVEAPRPAAAPHVEAVHPAAAPHPMMAPRPVAPIAPPHPAAPPRPAPPPRAAAPHPAPAPHPAAATPHSASGTRKPEEKH